LPTNPPLLFAIDVVELFYLYYTCKAIVALRHNTDEILRGYVGSNQR